MHKGLRQLHTLLHAGGILFDVAVPLFVQAHVPEHIRRARAGVFGRNAAHLGHVTEKFRCREKVWQAIVFRHVAQTHANGDVFVGLFPQDRCRAGGGPEQPEKQLHGCALARAIRPQQSRDAFANLHINFVQRDCLAVVLGQVSASIRGSPTATPFKGSDARLRFRP